VNPGLIGAYAAAAVAIIGAIFAGLAQLQHNRTQHGPTSGNSSPGDGSSAPQQRP
jgi:hypothetical protein